MQSTTKPVQLIVAQDFHGHRLMYARLLIEGAIARGRLPHLIVGDGTLRSIEYATHVAPLGESLEVSETSPLNVPTLKQLARSHPEYPTVFPEGDIWLPPLLRGTRWPGGARLLVMRTRGQSASPVHRSLATAVKWGRMRAARIRPDLNVFALGSFSTTPSRHILPDPIFLDGSRQRASELRAEWAVHSGRTPTHWFGVIGALSQRKNIELVARCLANLRRSDIGLVLAGHCVEGEESIDQWTSAARDRGLTVVRHTGFLPDHELDSMVRALDCVVLAHSNEGPSGLFGKAVAAGTYVVAAGAQSLKRDVTRIGAGSSWAPLLETDLTATLRNSMAKSGRPTRQTGGGHFVERLLGPKRLDAHQPLARAD